MKKTKWTPQIDEEYYTMDSIYSSTYRGNKFDTQQIESGNYFQTPELRQQAIEMLKNAFHGYTLKKPALFPENQLPLLNANTGMQIADIQFVDKENNLIVFAKVYVDVTVDIDGDDYNLPRTTSIKSKIYALEVDMCDKDGDEVEDENELFYNEVLNILTNIYEN